MQRGSTRSAIRSRGRGLLLEGLALAVALSLATPRRAGAGGDGETVRDLLPEFNAICVELETSRRALAAGTLDGNGFADRVLSLFVRADSLASLLAERHPAPRRDLASWTFERGLRFLKSALRENYEGIVGRNGYRFVSADEALRAAVAWRSAVSLPPVGAP